MNSPTETSTPDSPRQPPPVPRQNAKRSAIDVAILAGAAFSVVIVTGIAAVISYGHAYQLVLDNGETGATARALPLTIDGLIATCSLVILHYARHDRTAPWHAWALLALGVAATVGANVAHGLAHGPIGAIVAGWPALIATGSFELLIRLLRDADPRPRGYQDAAPSLHANPDVLAARDRFADVLDEDRIPSVRAIMRELRVGHPRAAKIRAGLQSLAASRATPRPEHELGRKMSRSAQLRPVGARTGDDDADAEGERLGE